MAARVAACWPARRAQWPCAAPPLAACPSARPARGCLRGALTPCAGFFFFYRGFTLTERTEDCCYRVYLSVYKTLSWSRKRPDQQRCLYIRASRCGNPACDRRRASAASGRSTRSFLVGTAAARLPRSPDPSRGAAGSFPTVVQALASSRLRI